MLNKYSMKFLYLFLLVLITACATTAPEYIVSSPEFYSVSQSGGTLYKQPRASGAGHSTIVTQKLLVVGRKAPNWLVVKMDGILYFIDATYLVRAEERKSTYDYSTPAYSPSINNPAHSIQTGPRGGKYYINKNGNKTYIKR